MKLIISSKNLNNLTENEEIHEELSKLIKLEQNIKLKIFFPKDSKYKIEQIKELIKSFSRKKDLENEYIYVVMKAELLTDVTQNALLKTLEESDYSIIFVTSNIDSLLPTLISRCQTLFDNSLHKDIADSKQNVFAIADIARLSKLTRPELISMLESKINSQEIDNILFYQKAIDQINSNCKIESILFELVNKL